MQETILPVIDQAAYLGVIQFLEPEQIERHLLGLIQRSEHIGEQLRGPTFAEKPSEVAEAAHSLAGSAGMFGLRRLDASARRFERAVETSASNVAELADDLSEAIKASIPVLQSLTRNGSLQ